MRGEKAKLEIIVVPTAEQGRFKRKETKVAKARKERFFARLSVLRDFALNVQVISASLLKQKTLPFEQE